MICYNVAIPSVHRFESAGRRSLVMFMLWRSLRNQKCFVEARYWNDHIVWINSVSLNLLDTLFRLNMSKLRETYLLKLTAIALLNFIVPFKMRNIYIS